MNYDYIRDVINYLYSLKGNNEFICLAVGRLYIFNGLLNGIDIVPGSILPGKDLVIEPKDDFDISYTHHTTVSSIKDSSGKVCFHYVIVNKNVVTPTFLTFNGIDDSITQINFYEEHYDIVGYQYYDKDAVDALRQHLGENFHLETISSASFERIGIEPDLNGICKKQMIDDEGNGSIIPIINKEISKHRKKNSK